MVTGVKIQTKDVSFDDTMETLSDKRVRQQETIAISTAFLEVIGLLECSTTQETTKSMLFVPAARDV